MLKITSVFIAVFMNLFYFITHNLDESLNFESIIEFSAKDLIPDPDERSEGELEPCVQHSNHGQNVERGENEEEWLCRPWQVTSDHRRTPVREVNVITELFGNNWGGVA